MRFDFVGGSYADPILRADAQATINLYKETDKSGTGKSKAQLVGCPGTNVFCTLPKSPLRGIWVGVDRLFVVAGDHFYEVFQGGSFNDRGALAGGTDICQVFPNQTGLQLGIVCSGWFYVDTGTAIIPVKDNQGNNVLASCGTQMDGYAIVGVPNTNQFRINVIANKDFKEWNAADIGTKEAYPDHIQNIISDSINLYLLGNQTIEVFRDTGNPDFAFERIPGEVLQFGIAAKSSVDRLGNGIIFLANDPRGGPAAMTLQGYQWARVSTPPIETVWGNYSKVDDAVGFVYLDGGHTFWCLSFPTANATWVYDAVEDSWHQRGYWNGFSLQPNSLQRTQWYLHGYCWGKHLVGDYASGNIYQLSRNLYQDGTQPILRQRTASHIANENKRVAFHQFTLDVQTGQIAMPAFTLDWSNDGGNTWSAPYTQSAGAFGDFRARFNWRRLGQSRVRTFRVSSTSPMLHNWIDAYYEASPSND